MTIRLNLERIRPKYHFLAVIVLAIVSSAGGCGRAPTSKVSGSYGNLEMIQRAYFLASQESELGRPPKNPEELIPFLKLQGGSEETLRSPDDGEPYQIHWGMDLRTPKVVFAYEKNGNNGVRWVCYDGAVSAMNESEFRKASFPPGYQPP